MRSREAITMLLEAVKESIVRAKSCSDAKRTNKYQQLLDDIISGRARISYRDTAKQKVGTNDPPRY